MKRQKFTCLQNYIADDRQYVWVIKNGWLVDVVLSDGTIIKAMAFRDGKHSFNTWKLLDINTGFMLYNSCIAKNTIISLVETFNNKFSGLNITFDLYCDTIEQKAA